MNTILGLKVTVTRFEKVLQETINVNVTEKPTGIPLLVRKYIAIYGRIFQNRFTGLTWRHFIL